MSVITFFVLLHFKIFAPLWRTPKHVITVQKPNQDWALAFLRFYNFENLPLPREIENKNFLSLIR